MAKNPFIQLNLRPWRLSKTSENEYVAEVIYSGKTMDNKEIAAEVARRIGVVSEDVVLSVLNLRDEVALEAIVSGKPVQDGIGRLAIKVTGPWIGDVREFNRNIHKVTVGHTLTDKARKAVDKVGFGVLGDTPVPAQIGRITDVTTGRTDNYMTLDADIIIEGERIKLAPLSNSAVRVTFTNAASGAVFYSTTPPALNTSGKVIIRVPGIPAGFYSIAIDTYFTKGKRLLNTLRTITYPALVEGKPMTRETDVKTDAEGSSDGTPARTKPKR